MTSIKTIIVACDGSEHSAKAAEYAGVLAKALKAPVHLVHAFPASPVDLLGMPGPTAEMVGIDRFDEETFRRMWANAAAESFKVGSESLGDSVKDVETVKLSGDPSKAIIDYAKNQKDPVIVIGRRGMGRFREALLGSVSQRVLHWANCPVFVTH
jgi:nucleotide-binding universal stress UspA family protein